MHRASCYPFYVACRMLSVVSVLHSGQALSFSERTSTPIRAKTANKMIPITTSAAPACTRQVEHSL